MRQKATLIFIILLLSFLVACAPGSSNQVVPTIASVASVGNAVSNPQPRATVEIPPTFTPHASLGIESVEDFEDTDLSSGQTIFDLSQSALAETRTYRFEETTLVEWHALWLRETWKQSCAVQHPNIAYCTISARLQYNDEPTPFYVTEYVQIGNQLWTRDASQHLWVEEPPIEQSDEGSSDRGFFDLVITDYAHEVTSLRRGLLEDVAAYEIISELDMHGYLHSIIDFDSIGEEAVIPLTESNIGRWWIGVEDGLVHKMQVETTYTVDDNDIDVSVKGEYFEFNQPVELPGEFDDKLNLDEQNT